jgi:hypothetical protein
LNSWKCWDGRGTPTFTNQPTAEQTSCARVDAQALTLDYLRDGYYSLKTSDGQCFDLAAQTADDDTPLVVAACNAEQSQAWLPAPQADGSYLLIDGLTGKCADVAGYQVADGVGIQQYSCSAGGNQRWLLALLSPQSLPFAVDRYFVPTIWSSQATVTLTPLSGSNTTTCNATRAPAAQGDCHIVAIDTFPSDPSSSSGATWVYPARNWGRIAGLPVEAGAIRVRFQARGEKGGEVVEFHAGGVSGYGNADTLSTPWQPITLTNTWTTYVIDLRGQDYGGFVLGSFSWSLDFSANKAPFKFYVDDIVWE